MRIYSTLAKPRAMIDHMDINRDHFTGATTIFEPDGSSQPTGLLDQRGNMIFACERTGPIGFNR